MAISENSSDSPAESRREPESWPRKLNKALIALGVIAFGLIVTDRLIEMFRADDAPADVALIKRVDSTVGNATETQVIQASEPAEETALAESSSAAAAISKTQETATNPELVELEKLFGSAVVFVSAGEPLYVITEDERRFDVGSSIDSSTTLAGVTDQQLIIEKSGDLMIMSLPDPTAQ